MVHNISNGTAMWWTKWEVKAARCVIARPAAEQPREKEEDEAEEGVVVVVVAVVEYRVEKSVSRPFGIPG